LDDVSGVVLTPVGVALCLAGLLDRRWRRYGPWLAAVAILIALLPRKFYEMNYYHLAVLPPLCLLVGLGGQVVYERLGLSRRAVGLLLAVALLFSLRYALGPVLGDAAEDRAVVAAGRAIQARTTAEEPVVTMHGTTIDLLYYCRRPGWAVALDTPDLATVLENHRRQGARYLVVAGAEARQFRAGRFARWDPVERGADFAIYALKAP
jgi:hypothetical protein